MSAFLVDDRTARGAADFEGELLLLGSPDYPDWAAVAHRLMNGEVSAGDGSPALA